MSFDLGPHAIEKRPGPAAMLDDLMALDAPRLQTHRVYLIQVQESSYIQNH